MKAFVLERYGKKRELTLAEMPLPQLRDDEVMLEVHAAGVNLLDAKIRSGEFKRISPSQQIPFLAKRSPHRLVTAFDESFGC